jgi:hypothetical protein
MGRKSEEWEEGNMSEPSDGRRLSGLLTAIKGLTISNVVVIAMLVVIAVPAYTVYRALNDERLLDRFLSTYEEITSQITSCTVRHVQERGGPELWGISSGFAYQGATTWAVHVVLTHNPSTDEIASYCETLKLITDRMLENNGNGKPQ